MPLLNYINSTTDKDIYTVTMPTHILKMVDIGKKILSNLSYETAELLGANISQRRMPKNVIIRKNFNTKELETSGIFLNCCFHF